MTHRGTCPFCSTSHTLVEQALPHHVRPSTGRACAGSHLAASHVLVVIEAVTWWAVRLPSLSERRPRR